MTFWLTKNGPFTVDFFHFQLKQSNALILVSVGDKVSRVLLRWKYHNLRSKKVETFIQKGWQWPAQMDIYLTN